MLQSHLVKYHFNHCEKMSTYLLLTPSVLEPVLYLSSLHAKHLTKL